MWPWDCGWASWYLCRKRRVQDLDSYHLSTETRQRVLFSRTSYRKCIKFFYKCVKHGFAGTESKGLLIPWNSALFKVWSEELLWRDNWDTYVLNWKHQKLFHQSSGICVKRYRFGRGKELYHSNKKIQPN